jgi:hypothetical protein
LSPLVASGPYRPTKVLEPGQATTEIEVFANCPWNETGLYLEPGYYTFTAAGTWRDRTITSGPAGATGLRRFNPLVEGGRLLGTLLGHGEKLFKRMTRNKVADFMGAPREEDLPWMSLIGVVANDAVALGDDESTCHERIAIGAGTSCRVTKGGYLYAFANDAWGLYGNNEGSVRLTVTRISEREQEKPLTEPKRRERVQREAVSAGDGAGQRRSGPGNRRSASRDVARTQR